MTSWLRPHCRLSCFSSGCQSLFPEHAEEIRQASHWRRFNRAGPGDIEEGECIGELPMASLGGDEAPLQTFLDGDVPTAIVAGSYS